MALVAFLKGINVGGHRRFRPSVLAQDLRHLDVVNIGAAGTLVIRGSITKSNLRASIADRTPFDVEVMICSGKAIIQLISGRPFDNCTAERDVIQFVSVLAKRGKPLLPFSLPSDADWCLRFLKCQGLFVVGLHKRQMKAIAYLDQLESILGAPMTTRSWSTILRIGKVLQPSAG